VRIVALLLVCSTIAGCLASGSDGYVVPGVETGEVMMNVHVWGEVVSPGTHLVPYDADLIIGLSEAGGPTGDADLRDIRLVFEDFELEYDLSDYLDGISEPPPPLLPGTTIFVARRNIEWWKETIDIGYKVLVAVNLIWIMIDR